MNNTHDENEGEPVYNEVENPIPEMTDSLTKKRIFTPKESLLLDRSMSILLWMLFPVMLTNLILIVGTFSILGNNRLYLFSEYHSILV